MQIAYRAGDLAEAHIVAGLLQAHGIESHVGGHYLQGAMGEIGAAGFTNVHVGDDDYLNARSLVQEYESEARSTEASAGPAAARSESCARGFLLVFLTLILVILVFY